MGVINETLKLTDHFSAAFQTFIQMGSRSAGTAQALQESTDQYARTSQYAAQQLDALKGVLASQESLYAAQGQRLDAQRQKVAELAARHAKLAASKGMEARRGSSAVERAVRLVKPATPMGVMELSVPPATMTSASPCWMARMASPMEWVPVAQAVTTFRLLPFKPNWIDTFPAAMLLIINGTRRGLIRPGPFSRSF